MIDTPVLILAGGFGTRLRSITHDLPKPLANINGKPFLQYLLESLIQQSFCHFILSLHYQADMIVKFIREFLATSPRSIQIDYIIEPEPLGTGGAIKYAAIESGLSNDMCLIINGDTFLPGGVKKLYNQCLIHPRTTLGLISMKKNDRYGSVSLDGDMIISFNEKNKTESQCLINSGSYSVQTEPLVNHNKDIFSLESDFFPLLVSRKQLYGFNLKTPFIDIGVPEDYNKFCAWVKNKHP